MPRIKVDNNKKVYYGSSYGQISFSIVSAPKHGLKQVRCFATCRDYISDCIIAAANAHHFNEGKGTGYWTEKDNSPVDFNYLRLLIAKDPSKNTSLEIDKRRIFKAKHIINMYEELAGFKRKSTIRQVDHSSGKVPNCWLLTGPSQWMKATQLVSMVTLIFRVVVTHGGFSECENLDQVEERFKELCKAGSNSGSMYGVGTGDLKYLLPDSWPRFRALMVKHNELFGNKPREFWFPKTGVGNWHGQGGIHSLCTFSGNQPHIKEAVKQAFARHAAKK